MRTIRIALYRDLFCKWECQPNGSCLVSETGSRKSLRSKSTNGIPLRMVQKFLLGDFLLRSERGEDFFYSSTHTSQRAHDKRGIINQRAEPTLISINNHEIQIQMNLGRLESIKEGSGRTRTAISVFLWIWQVVPFPLSPTNYIILFFSTNHRRGKRNVLI